MPRKRPFPAAICASSASAASFSPVRSGAVPTMPAAMRQGPYLPEALMAATPFTNSVSPTHFMCSGPSARNIDPHSM